LGLQGLDVGVAVVVVVGVVVVGVATVVVVGVDVGITTGPVAVGIAVAHGKAEDVADQGERLL
jgi:hypothetical protein